ncbi:hypothetical protein NKI54_35455, partial [Mesorhizobium sp. M0663]
MVINSSAWSTRSSIPPRLDIILTQVAKALGSDLSDASSGAMLPGGVAAARARARLANGVGPGLTTIGSNE